MKKCLVVGLVGLMVLFGCDQLKGPKGDKGDSGLIGTKTYTGYPTSNPYTVSCPEITDLSKQVVDVYAVYSDGGYTKLPLTVPHSDGVTDIHAGDIYVGKVILATIYSDNTVPSVALRDHYSGYQWGYRIEIKNFSSAPAKAIYLDKQRSKGTTAGWLNSGLRIDE